VESPSAEDDVIEKPDAHEFGGLLEALRDLPVLAGGCRITARVVMNQDERGRVRQDDPLEDLEGVDEARRRGAHRDLLQADRLVASVKKKGEKTLQIPGGHLIAKQLPDARGATDGLLSVVGGGVAHELDAHERHRRVSSFHRSLL